MARYVTVRYESEPPHLVVDGAAVYPDLYAVRQVDHGDGSSHWDALITRQQFDALAALPEQYRGFTPLVAGDPQPHVFGPGRIAPDVEFEEAEAEAVL